MKRILYFDCFSGISGDMTVAAMLDLGLDADKLKGELLKLDLSGYHIEVSQQTRGGIGGTYFQVAVQDSVHQHGRHLPEIEAIISGSSLEPEVKANSMRTFRHLADAEARIHKVSKEKLHFHEVGAIDSIIDIVAVAVCMNWLKPERVLASAVNTGSGFVNCAHGRLPVPAPATLELLKGFAAYGSSQPFELATPTGAAILKTYAEAAATMPLMTVNRSGYGCGCRDLEEPNLLRIIEGQDAALQVQDLVPGNCWLLETNIDDMNPEYYSHLFPLLLEKGALDVFVTPVIMKKNRPGHLLSILCRSERLARLEEAVLRETTTFGLRKYQVQREELERDNRMAVTRYGPLPFKCGLYKGETIKFSPEYEHCRRLALDAGRPLLQVWQEIMSDAAGELAGGLTGDFTGGLPEDQAEMRRHKDHDG